MRIMFYIYYVSPCFRLLNYRTSKTHDIVSSLYTPSYLSSSPFRLISVLESMDNGKTIRESRDCDIPLVARHLYHHSGISLHAS